MTAIDLFAETVRLAKKKKRHDALAGVHLSWAEEAEVLCEYDPMSSVASIKDPEHVDEDHNQIPWDEQEYEEPPWWEVPDLDDDDALTALCKKVMAAGDTEMDQVKAEKVESRVINFALKLKNKSAIRKLSSQASKEKKKDPAEKAAKTEKRRSFIKEVTEEKKKEEEPAKSSSVPSWKKQGSKSREDSSSEIPKVSAKKVESTSASSSVPSWKASRQRGDGPTNTSQATHEANGSSSKPVPAWKAKQKEAENKGSKVEDVADKPVPAWKARREAQAKNRTISEPVNSGRASSVRTSSAPVIGGKPQMVKDCSNSSSVLSLISRFEK